MSGPGDDLRSAWTGIVAPEDYEAHMAAVGQAKANAELLRHLVTTWPPLQPTLLIAGAGSGQMLEFTGAGYLEPYRVTFTDISRPFLERLEARLAGGTWRDYEVFVDDLEDTRLTGPFGGAAAVLVLEHVDWRRAVSRFPRLRASRFYLIIQENPPRMTTAVTPTRPAIGTMEVFRRVHPCLVPERELTVAMQAAGYTRLALEPREVPDGKKMLGLVFGSGLTTPR